LKQTLVREAVPNFAELNDRWGFGTLVRVVHPLEWYRTRARRNADIRHSAPVLCTCRISTTICGKRLRHSVLSLLTPEERNKVKKLLTMAFALVLTASLSFAQASGSSDQSGTSGSTASSGQTSTGDQGSSTKTTKKHHKHHKKGSTTDSGSSAPAPTTSNPK